MAKAMTETTSVPHFYYVDEILVDSLIKLRQNLQGISLGPGVKLTYLPFMIKALSAALSKYPVMNATVNSDLTQITCIGEAIEVTAVEFYKNLQVQWIFR